MSRPPLRYVSTTRQATSLAAGEASGGKNSPEQISFQTLPEKPEEQAVNLRIQRCERGKEEKVLRWEK